jgi:hypothetical protein
VPSSERAKGRLTKGIPTTSAGASAPILDEEWLERFRQRKVVLLPGDALRCRIKFTYIYDEKGELIGQRMEIEKVLEVIQGPGEQKRLFQS